MGMRVQMIIEHGAPAYFRVERNLLPAAVFGLDRQSERHAITEFDRVSESRQRNAISARSEHHRHPRGQRQLRTVAMPLPGRRMVMLAAASLRTATRAAPSLD